MAMTLTCPLRVWVLTTRTSTSLTATSLGTTTRTSTSLTATSLGTYNKDLYQSDRYESWYYNKDLYHSEEGVTQFDTMLWITLNESIN